MDDMAAATLLEIHERSKLPWIPATGAPEPLRAQLQIEMVRSDVHAAVEVETVGGETLHPGIEGEVLAAVFLGVIDQPIEEGCAESARAVGIVSDKVVDVEGAA